MKRLIAAAVIVDFLCVPSAEAAERRVPLPLGETAATLKGNTSGRGEQDYVRKASAGQVLQGLFGPSNRAGAVNMFQPGLASVAHIGLVALATLAKRSPSMGRVSADRDGRL